MQCEVDDEIEYEFPCFNLVETLEGLWDPDDFQYQSSDSCYGGLRLCQPRAITHLTMGIFPHIQVCYYLYFMYFKIEYKKY